jgi:hypothetical protein
MRWEDVRRDYPDRWLVIEALQAHTSDRRRVLDDVAVVEACADGGRALARYRILHREDPERELYFVHTANTELVVEERSWTGVRRNDFPHASR